MLVLATVTCFWIVLNILYTRFRNVFENKGFKLYYGVILVWKRRSEVRSVRVYKKISYIHIPLFIFALVNFYLNMFQSIAVRMGFTRGIPVEILIPGVNITGVNILYFIIAVSIAAIVHELSHAYTARSHGLKVKSLGFIIAFILPLAFTEIDDEEFKKIPVKNRVAILASGPSVNLLLSLIALYIASLVMSPTGIVILSVEENSLAYKYGLKPGDVILEINGEQADRLTLAKYVSNKTGLNLTLKILSNGVVKTLEIYKPENITKLGISFTMKPYDHVVEALGLDTAVALQLIILWLYVVNLGLSVVNSAPLFISDGGRIVYEVSKNKPIGHTVNILSLIILILAVAPLK